MATPSCPFNFAFNFRCLLSLSTVSPTCRTDSKQRAEQLLLLSLTKFFYPGDVLPSQPEISSQVSLSTMQYYSTHSTITNARPHTERLRKSLLAELGKKFLNDKNLQALTYTITFLYLVFCFKKHVNCQNQSISLYLLLLFPKSIS